jgi:hypothetical protein
MLLTAGCSFVWGDELEGFDQDPPTHWGLTFTSIVARKLGLDYENRGVCGACNEKIFREITDYLHENPNKVTHMVVMWSAWQRSEVVEYMPDARDVKIGRQTDTTQFSQLRTELIWDRDKRRVMKDWFDTAYDSKTDIMHTLSKMKMMESYCDAAGIKLIQGVFHKRNWSNVMSVLTNMPADDSSKKILEKPFRIDSIPDYKKWLISSIESLDVDSRVGLGKGKDLYTLCRELKDMKEFGHPGERTQEVFAEFLIETFEKSNQKEV